MCHASGIRKDRHDTGRQETASLELGSTANSWKKDEPSLLGYGVNQTDKDHLLTIEQRFKRIQYWHHLTLSFKWCSQDIHRQTKMDTGRWSLKLRSTPNPLAQRSKSHRWVFYTTRGHRWDIPLNTQASKRLDFTHTQTSSLIILASFRHLQASNYK